MTKVLGAILAGGRSSRFGGDKALALYRGRPLIDHVRAALESQCDGLVVCGRSWDGLVGVADRPEPGLGPLGGLCGALFHAREAGFDLVLSCGCDTPDPPADLLHRLGGASAYAANLPVLGLWRADDAGRLLAWMAASRRRSVIGWGGHIGARPVDMPAMANVNYPEDLGRLSGS